LSAAARATVQAHGALDVPYGTVKRLRHDGQDLPGNGGPDGMLMRDNAPLYAERGVQATRSALCEGGTIAYWSVGDDPRFAAAVEGAGLRVATHRVRAHVTSGPWHTIYLATPTTKRPR